VPGGPPLSCVAEQVPIDAIALRAAAARSAGHTAGGNSRRQLPTVGAIEAARQAAVRDAQAAESAPVPGAGLPRLGGAVAQLARLARATPRRGGGAAAGGGHARGDGPARTRWPCSGAGR
jgi:hypothetical protein